MIKKTILFILIILPSSEIFCQTIFAIPQHWYKNINDTNLQLIIYQKNIRDAKVNLLSDIVKISKRHRNEDINSLKLDLSIPSNYSANIIPFEFQIKKRKSNFNYTLLEKKIIDKEKIVTDSFIYFINRKKVNLEKYHDLLISTIEKDNKNNDSIIVVKIDEYSIIRNLRHLERSIISKKIKVLNIVFEQTQDEYNYNIVLQQSLLWWLDEKIDIIAIRKSKLQNPNIIDYLEKNL